MGSRRRRCGVLRSVLSILHEGWELMGVQLAENMLDMSSLLEYSLKTGLGPRETLNMFASSIDQTNAPPEIPAGSDGAPAPSGAPTLTREPAPHPTLGGGNASTSNAAPASPTKGSARSNAPSTPTATASTPTLTASTSNGTAGIKRKAGAGDATPDGNAASTSSTAPAKPRSQPRKRGRTNTNGNAS